MKIVAKEPLMEDETTRGGAASGGANNWSRANEELRHHTKIDLQHKDPSMHCSHQP